jgi:hypothetical protein
MRMIRADKNPQFAQHLMRPSLFLGSMRRTASRSSLIRDEFPTFPRHCGSANRRENPCNGRTFFLAHLRRHVRHFIDAARRCRKSEFDRNSETITQPPVSTCARVRGLVLSHQHSRDLSAAKRPTIWASASMINHSWLSLSSFFAIHVLPIASMEPSSFGAA